MAKRPATPTPKHEMEVARAIAQAANLPERVPAISEAVFDEFCSRIAQGRLIMQVCSDPDMPTKPTLYWYLARNENWFIRLSRARALGQLSVTDDIVNIACAVGTTDQWAPQEFEKPSSENGAEVTKPKPKPRQKLEVDKARLMIESLKWVASKLSPKMYGENKNLDVPTDAAAKTSNVLDVSDLDDEELDVLERVLRKSLKMDGP